MTAEQEEWGLHAGCTVLSACKAVCLVSLLAVVSAAGGAYLVWPVAFGAGATAAAGPAFDKGVLDGQEIVRDEVRDACQCWFDDTRCKPDNAVVACRGLAWMKE